MRNTKIEGLRQKLKSKAIIIVPILVAAMATSAFVLYDMAVNLERGSLSGRPMTVTIRMTTFNWGFNITSIPDFQFNRVYPSPKITVYKGQRVVIYLRSLDILHGLAIDEFGVSVYAPPGEEVVISFVASKVGTFAYYCNVFCGVGHPFMRGIFEVLPA